MTCLECQACDGGKKGHAVLALFAGAAVIVALAARRGMATAIAAELAFGTPARAISVDAFGARVARWIAAGVLACAITADLSVGAVPLAVAVDALLARFALGCLGAAWLVLALAIAAPLVRVARHAFAVETHMTFRAGLFFRTAHFGAAVATATIIIRAAVADAGSDRLGRYPMEAQALLLACFTRVAVRI